VGGLYLDLGKPEVAMLYFDKALRANPESHIALHEMGNAAMSQKNYDEAVKYYDRALASGAPELFKALVLNNRSIAMERLGKMEESFRNAERANKLDPLLPGPYLRLATFYVRQQQTDRAISLLEEAIERTHPREFDIYYLLGNLYLGFGLSEKAFETVNAYRKINPFETRMYYFLAEVYIRHKQYDKALVAYQQVLKYAPKHSQTHAMIGNLFELAGRKDRAKEFYEKALEYDADNEYAKKKLAEFEGLGFEEGGEAESEEVEEGGTEE
jgi:tetratricopeptide (TPR) repeat protein